jgi:UDP-N-acetylmuramoyl-L-alanyl-D-glutamate--2,6-diaminopimelate ligase
MKLRDLLGQDVLGSDAAIEPAVAELDVTGLASQLDVVG